MFSLLKDNVPFILAKYGFSPSLLNMGWCKPALGVFE